MGSDARDRHGNSPPRGAERGFPGWSPLAGEELRAVPGRARKEVGTRAATTVSGRVQTPECPGNGEGGMEDFSSQSGAGRHLPGARPGTGHSATQQRHVGLPLAGLRTAGRCEPRTHPRWRAEAHPSTRACARTSRRARTCAHPEQHKDSPGWTNARLHVPRCHHSPGTQTLGLRRRSLQRARARVALALGLGSPGRAGCGHPEQVRRENPGS